MRWLNFILICCSAVAQGPPDSVYGVYTKHTGDSVRVGKLADGKVSVSCRLIFGAGQTCELEGQADWKDNLLTLRADGLEDSKPCALELRFAGGKVTLKDTGNNCRPVYCGSRGTFEGVVLAKSVARKKQPVKPPAKVVGKN